MAPPSQRFELNQYKIFEDKSRSKSTVEEALRLRKGYGNVDEPHTTIVFDIGSMFDSTGLSTVLSNGWGVFIYRLDVGPFFFVGHHVMGRNQTTPWHTPSQHSSASNLCGHINWAGARLD